MKCIICFEATTGIKPGDQFVITTNGHVFHHCCVVKMIAGGTPLCPICDEDLRSQPFVKQVPQEAAPPVPPRPPKPVTPSNGRRYANSLDEGSLNIMDSRRLVAPPASQSQTVSYCVDPDATFKIVILGDMNVGKSSLLQRYADERFDSHNMTTTGCDLRVKVIKMAGKTVRLNLWDTAGQERHRALVNMYLRRADGILFCFDITDTASFLALRTWYEFAQRNVSQDTIKIIVGNKSDLWSQRTVRSSQIMNLAEAWNAQYMYTSAKDATNVEAVFRSLAGLILEKRLPSMMVYSTAPSAPPITAGQQLGNPNYDYTGGIRLSRASKNGKKKKNTDCCNV